MWRAFFYAVGTMLLIVGIECLLIDSATWAAPAVEQPPAYSPGFFSASRPAASPGRTFKPADWAPWSALLTGGVILLYAHTLRRKGS